jgi:hypothetical protein
VACSAPKNPTTLGGVLAEVRAEAPELSRDTSIGSHSFAPACTRLNHSICYILSLLGFDFVFAVPVQSSITKCVEFR